MGEDTKILGWTIKHGDYKSNTSSDEQGVYYEKKRKYTKFIYWTLGIVITSFAFYGMLELINLLTSKR